MDNTSSKVRTTGSTSNLLHLLNLSNGDSVNSQARPVSHRFTTPCASPDGNNVLYHALAEALAISEEMERFMMAERGQDAQSNALAQYHSHFQNNGDCSKQ